MSRSTSWCWSASVAVATTTRSSCSSAGHQVAERLAGAGAGLDQQVLAGLHRRPDRLGHLAPGRAGPRPPTLPTAAAGPPRRSVAGVRLAHRARLSRSRDRRPCRRRRSTGRADAPRSGSDLTVGQERERRRPRAAPGDESVRRLGGSGEPANASQARLGTVCGRGPMDASVIRRPRCMLWSRVIGDAVVGDRPSSVVAAGPIRPWRRPRRPGRASTQATVKSRRSARPCHCAYRRRPARASRTPATAARRSVAAVRPRTRRAHRPGSG